MGFASRPSAPALEDCGNEGHVAAVTENARDEAPKDSPGTAEDPATSQKRGSYNYDREHGRYLFEWKDIADFEAWRREEELADSIEIISSSTYHGGPRALWTKRRVFVCRRQLPGGKSKYVKKHPDWKRKLLSKKTGCRFHLVIKHYPHMPAILGHYERNHDHATGSPNLMHTRMSRQAREKIKFMLRQKIDPREIVQEICNASPDQSHDQFISLAHIRRMGRIIEEEKIRLDAHDAISTKLWMDRLEADNIRIFHKDKIATSPSGSNLDHDAYVLCIQTPFQLDAFRRLGSRFIGIDATHNITQYEDFLLFTIVARDRWGHGVLVAWMLASNGTMDTISFFVRWVWDGSPAVAPSVIMTDRDQAQIGALKIVYPASWILLCKWHVLRAMRSHLNIIEFSELWIKVQALVNTQDATEFDKIWKEISSDPLSPKTFIDYMASQWITDKKAWSLVYRKNRSIFVEGDTNMLIEAYHHILKSHWLDSKRNRRIDRILYTLVQYLDPYYQSRHARQTVGFAGLDLAAARQEEIESSAKDIPLDSVLNFDSIQFHVASQSRPGEFYMIDLIKSTCDCPDFPRISFCKHIAAIYLHFPHLCPEGNSTPITQEIDNTPLITDPSPPQHISPPPSIALQKITQDITELSQSLGSQEIDQSPDAPAILEAARSAKYTLTAAIALSQGVRALPEKETIAPNQNSWPETVERMGGKHAPKRKRQPEEYGLAAKSIGVIKNKKRRTHTDPYAGGERLGKRAKPDAMSVAANQRARAGAPLPSNAVIPSNVLAHTLASAPGVALPNSYAFTSVPGVVPPNAYAFPFAPPFASMPGITFPNGPIPPFHYFPLASVATASAPTVPGGFPLPGSHAMSPT